MTPTRDLPLANGRRIPTVGLGVFRASGPDTRSAVTAALQLGWRHVDTAAVYGNEADVGAAIRDAGVPRDEVFVTTKLWNADQGPDRAEAAFDASLRRLGLGHVDLYLLHWPVRGQRLASWKVLERLHADGRARAIGVSNFLVRHLEELAAHARTLPMVNQIEIHPFHAQPETRAWCARHGVVVEAYSPLAKGLGLAHPAVAGAAARLGRTPAQVLLRWGLEQGLVVLPKSIRRERIAENGALFDWALDDEARAALAALDQGRATGWDPRQEP
jgi:diketogulonate reductase-like aldo/keto reductase